MIHHKLGRLVQWKEGDAHMVGQVVDVLTCQSEYDLDTGEWCVTTLIALAHTHELVSVEASKLSDYPAFKIPEPTK